MKLLTIGLVRTVHGVRGALKVRSTSGEFDHFKALQSVRLAKKGMDDANAQAFEVVSVAGSAHAIILKLQGIDTPEAAAIWRGARVLAERQQAARCGDGEYYIADLEGCELVFNDEAVATVESVWDSGASDMLEVRTSGGMRNVPFRKEFIGTVDVERRRIELLEDWILE
ncbi:MAG: 16S rRNA processing protein RimM [Spirochaetaceae bacterium]|jgi:16S rRNA processing protein RimM|nr:MAG: 16S rRNA processing protein RimM [Spirochaetaceae bacterium]